MENVCCELYQAGKGRNMQIISSLALPLRPASGIMFEWRRVTLPLSASCGTPGSDNLLTPLLLGALEPSQWCGVSWGTTQSSSTARCLQGLYHGTKIPSPTPATFESYSVVSNVPYVTSSPSCSMICNCTQGSPCRFIALHHQS
jgi:hypothetical protein